MILSTLSAEAKRYNTYQLLNAFVSPACFRGASCDYHSSSQKTKKPTYGGARSNNERRRGELTASEEKEKPEVGNRFDGCTPSCPIYSTLKKLYYRLRMCGFGIRCRSLAEVRCCSGAKV